MVSAEMPPVFVEETSSFFLNRQVRKLGMAEAISLPW